MAKVRMTSRWVQAIKPDKNKRIEYRDQKIENLCLRIAPNSKKSWSLTYRRQSDGKLRRVTIGQFPVVSLADARRSAHDLKSRIAVGEDPAKTGKRVGQGKPDTFRDLALRYMNHHAEPNTKTAAGAHRMLRKDVFPAIGDEPLTEITRMDVASICENILERGSPVTANRTFELIRRICKWGIRRGLTDINPCEGLTPVAPEKSRDRVLSADELKSFWQRLPDTGLKWQFQLVLKVCLATAQRIGEVSGARWSEIDFEAKEWRLPSSRVKNAELHIVPMSDLAIDLFKEAVSYGSDGDHVFPSPKIAGEHIKARSATKAMNRVLGILNLTDATPHDLRRTAATSMASLDIDPTMIERVLNHSAGKAGVAGIYNRFSYIPQKRLALEAWASHLLEIVEGRPANGNVVNLR